jgi:hypothetical protein
MNVNWLLNPVTQIAVLSGVLGVGLIGSLTLWISLRMDVRAAKKAQAAYRETTEAAIAELRAAIEKTTEADEPRPAVSAAMAVQGLDLTNRTKALRMSRRGESVGSIAASLGVAQEEIELLLKLERLLEAPAA